MNRVTTFSTSFPSYHPRKGNPTLFVERVWAGLLQIDYDLYSDYLHPDGRPDRIKYSEYYKDFDPKYHTIRAGSRFKAGDFMLPRIWTGKPYRSKQFQFAPPLKIESVWNFRMELEGGIKMFFLDDKFIFVVEECKIARNDGFDQLLDFLAWFNKPFDGQIISWAKHIKY